MERIIPLTILPRNASTVMIRIAVQRASRRVSYGLPILLITAIIGLTLVLAPALAGRGLFQALLLPVLLVALGLGLGPALVAMAFGSVAGAVAVAAVTAPAGGAEILYAQVGLFAAEGATIAFIGAVVRAAIHAALSGPSLAGSPSVAARREAALVEQLTPREIEILRVAAAGRSAAEVAGDLYVSTNTVKTHLAHAYSKLGAHNRAEAVAIALRCGCLAADDIERAAGDQLAEP